MVEIGLHVMWPVDPLNTGWAPRGFLGDQPLMPGDKMTSRHLWGLEGEYCGISTGHGEDDGHRVHIRHPHPNPNGPYASGNTVLETYYAWQWDVTIRLSRISNGEMEVRDCD